MINFDVWEYAQKTRKSQRRKEAEQFLDKVGYDFNKDDLSIEDDFRYMFARKEVDELVREHKAKLRGTSELRNPYLDTRDMNGSYRVAENVRRSDGVPNSQVDYSKYGDGFSKDFIDEMLADKRFQRAMENRTKGNEGGFSNHKNDRGGKTNMGISQKWYPNEDIENLTRERVNAILYSDFWKKTNIYQLPDELSDIVFDDAVVQGQPTAIKHLQKALGVKADGLLGVITLQKSREADYNMVKREFVKNAKKRVKDIVKNDPSQQEFEDGWLNRIYRY